MRGGVVAVALAVLAGCSPAGPPAAPAAGGPASPAAAVEVTGSGRASGPVEILRAWDERRAAAYASGSVRALRRLYVPGSATGRADVRVLRGYVDRGLRVAGLRMQLLAVEVLGRRPGRLELRVTDRVHGGAVVGPGLTRPLPRDQASTRVVVLRRDRAGEWRVAAVHEPAA